VPPSDHPASYVTTVPNSTSFAPSCKRQNPIAKRSRPSAHRIAATAGADTATMSPGLAAEKRLCRSRPDTPDGHGRKRALGLAPGLIGRFTVSCAPKPGPGRRCPRISRTVSGTTPPSKPEQDMTKAGQKNITSGRQAGSSVLNPLGALFDICWRTVRIRAARRPTHRAHRLAAGGGPSRCAHGRRQHRRPCTAPGPVLHLRQRARGRMRRGARDRQRQGPRGPARWRSRPSSASPTWRSGGRHRGVARPRPSLDTRSCSS
jgi:hypothetical protein